MIVVVSDTHRSERPDLTSALYEDLKEAERVVHAGDFTTEAVLDAFQSMSRELLAVAGNVDTPGVTERLPTARTLDVGETTVAITHTQSGGETGLRYFGAERDADLVVFGHSHRATVVETDECVLLNPGSHADPRGNEPTYAVLHRQESGLEGTIKHVDGTVRRRFRVEGRSENGSDRGRNR